MLQVGHHLLAELGTLLGRVPGVHSAVDPDAFHLLQRVAEARVAATGCATPAAVLSTVKAMSSVPKNAWSA
jgi:hypothetical protein